MREQLYDQIKKQGKKLYVLSKEKNWSYEELQYYCAFYHKMFRDNGYDKVLLSTNQNFNAYSAILAAYLTGTTFCIINPDLPVERKQYMIETFQPSLIICSEADNLNNVFEEKVFHLEKTKAAIKEFEICSIEQTFNNDLVYVSFTSGSTGMPKGCKIKRKAFEQFCRWASDEFSLTEEDIYGQYVPLYFDMSLIDIFGGTLHGVTLVPFSNFSEKLRPGVLLKRYNITFLNVVPQFLEILIQTNQCSREYLKSIRMIRFGGDKIYKKRLDRLFEHLPDVKVVSTYGPTETTCFCFYKTVDKTTYKNHSKEIVTIGNTIPGWQAYLRNVEENVGEIVIYGSNIGAGYLHQEKDEHFSGEIINGQEVEVYYTGDYASMSNGMYYFEGRRDAQIKINGNRVSLIEVEYALMKMGCSEVVAIFLKDNIFCFYCTSNEIFESEAEIKIRLEDKLPRYAIPSELIKLPKMPYNANGKVDRNKLKIIAEKLIMEWGK
ncbi:acyl-CoA synthetase (AMP-forming)/AMP-acid ligase II [Natranaerovirga hydrolytica]|uniref:Acyl-CoA synthetase (AMP-forming)/AMP-acid ligase II n=1 Tax=Natranaerovirga hydrolytica TaxID=680378 RepID=A0A4R1MMT6_9FIRM|nr:AMP-binding protein [Natranaerovirga hydrolytica]TCK92604.1 acyl-CoA synthetase (AMP-forming)/AMP-acid ligase II [Natranaerovirga hydrolytica]